MKAMSSFLPPRNSQATKPPNAAIWRRASWVEGRVRQSGIGNRGDSAMLLQKLGDGQCRRAMPFRSPFQRLQVAQKEEGGQRRNSGAREVAQLMARDRFDDAFWSRHDADDKIAMPANELGR